MRALGCTATVARIVHCKLCLPRRLVPHHGNAPFVHQLLTRWRVLASISSEGIQRVTNWCDSAWLQALVCVIIGKDGDVKVNLRKLNAIVTNRLSLAICSSDVQVMTYLAFLRTSLSITQAFGWYTGHGCIRASCHKRLWTFALLFKKLDKRAVHTLELATRAEI